MPIPMVSEYIPDTTGEFQSGLSLARQIQANKNAAFERDLQTKQLKQRADLAQQAQINALMERGIEPVLGSDGRLDQGATFAKTEQNNQAKSVGAVHGLIGLEPDEEGVSNPHYNEGYRTGLQQRLINQTRENIAERGAGSRENIAGINAGSRERAAAERAQAMRDVAERRATSVRDAIELKNRLNPDLTWGGPTAQEVELPNGQKITTIRTGPKKSQILPDTTAGAEEVLMGDSPVGFRVGGKFHPYSATDKLLNSVKPVTGGIVTVKTKAERDALPKGTRYIGPDGKQATKQ